MLIGIDASRAFLPDRTGTENYSYQIIRNMVELSYSKGHRFILFVCGGFSFGDDEWLKKENIEVVEINLPRLWTQVGLAFETWKRKLDVLFVPAHTLPILRKPGIRTVVTIHGLEYEWLPEYKNLLQRWYLPLSTMYAARCADRLIAVSEFTKNQLIERFGIDSDRITVVHEGVDVDFFERKRPKSSVKEVFRKHGIKQPYILFVGSLQPRKNLVFMIRVYSRLRKQYSDLKFVIVGSKGWMYEGIYSAPARYRVKDGVVFSGRVSDEELVVLMQNAVLYVQPSISEGFGLPVFEAMAASLAVVSSSGGALPEVVGDAGLVLRGSQSEVFVFKNWVDSIAELIGNRKMRSDLIAKGCKRVKSTTWVQSAKNTFSVLVKPLI